MIVSRFDSSENSVQFSPLVVDILDYLNNLDLASSELGRFTFKNIPEDEAFFIVMEYDTVEKSPVGAEFHQTYTDIQFLVSGNEMCGWLQLSDEQRAQYSAEYKFDETKDICFVPEAEVDLNFAVLRPSEFYVFTPNTMHMPNLAHKAVGKVRKVVVKIRTELLGH